MRGRSDPTGVFAPVLARGAISDRTISMTGTEAIKSWTAWRALAWAALLAFGFAAATWLRYAVIQPSEIGILCGQADAPAWCTPRQWLLLCQHYFVWGW